MKTFFLSLLLIPSLFFSQNPYPQDYFINPLNVPIVLAGTFAELRSNHFHSGMDIKTQHRQGLDVVSAADGFVSRIKISPFGYGKAVYITHPNGYTTVYAHLQKLAPKLEAYLKARQYAKETFEIELFPPIKALVVAQGELIAYSGNTGSSGGPHLHFEIRDKNEHPINPMLFGINTKDTTKPIVTNLVAYPMDEHAQIKHGNAKQNIRLIHQPDGNFTTESIEAFGKIGFGVETVDRLDLAANKNGVYNIQTFVNGTLNFEIDFSTFSFDETRDINRLIDYEIYKDNKGRIQKLFIDTNNGLSLYKNTTNNGFLTVQDSTAFVYKIKISDFKGNDTWITININGKKQENITKKPVSITPYYLYESEAKTITEGNVSVNFYKNTFYDNFYLDFKVSNDTLQLLPIAVAARKNFKIDFDISKYSDTDKAKLFIAELVGYRKRPYYSNTTRTENTLTTYTKDMGYYTIVSDTKSPKITPINFSNGKWLSNYHYLKIKIEDDLSGISKFRGTINGKWILLEYDYKTNLLTYDFNDAVSTETKNNLKVIVTDNVGNSSTFEAMFYRK